jgi:hypothetical protein
MTGFASAPSTAPRVTAVASMNAIGFMDAKLRGLPRAVIGGSHPSSNRGYLRNLLCLRTRSAETREELTARERQIAQLIRAERRGGLLVAA